MKHTVLIMWRGFKWRSTGIIRIAGACGILLPFVIFVTLGISLSLSPWFIWTENALSDLGIQQNTAFLFNNGLILAGILTLIFSLGLIKILSNKTGAYFLMVSSVALIGIGLFPETIFTLHFLTSATFFVFLAIGLLIIGLTVKKTPFERRIGLLALLFVVLAVASSFFIFRFEGIALIEALCCFPAFIWCLITGMKMTYVGV
jgi:hypothetical membrane protein